jgi:hypothetical protein
VREEKIAFMRTDVCVICDYLIRVYAISGVLIIWSFNLKRLSVLLIMLGNLKSLSLIKSKLK